MSIIEHIRINGGYARTQELREAGFHTRDIAKLVENGDLVKLKPGFYRLPDVPETGEVNPGFVDVCKAIDGSVICLLSALAYYELTTFNSPEIYAAIPGDKKPPRQVNIPVKIFYFQKRVYHPGIDTISAGYGDVRIYSREKTLCDVFRYRKKLGEDIALEGLKSYLQSDRANIAQLTHFAEISKVKKDMMPYLKAFTIS